MDQTHNKILNFLAKMGKDELIFLGWKDIWFFIKIGTHNSFLYWKQNFGEQEIFSSHIAQTVLLREGRVARWDRKWSVGP